MMSRHSTLVLHPDWPRLDLQKVLSLPVDRSPPTRQLLFRHTLDKLSFRLTLAAVMSKVAVPNVKLSNGREVPQIGLGTWNSAPGEVRKAVRDAVHIGYRHIDCALAYDNEAEVGQGIKEVIKDGVVTREDLFVTSKIWNTYHSKGAVRECVKRSLDNLQTPYLDLCLIHWPMGYQEGTGDLLPKNDKGDVVYSDVDYLETWEGLEQCCKEGLVRSIGLSNFNSEQIDRVCKAAEINPAMLQVECHPYLKQKQLIEFCKAKCIAVTAYSCLGSPARPSATDQEPVVMEDPVIKDIADTVQRTPAQVCLRYQLQRGVVVIPKSVSKNRLRANFDVFDFTLSDEQMKKIDSIPSNVRLVKWFQHHPYYPFNIEF